MLKPTTRYDVVMFLGALRRGFIAGLGQLLLVSFLETFFRSYLMI